MSENAIKSIAQDFKSLLIKSQKEIQGKTKRQNNMLQSLKQVKQNIKKMLCTRVRSVKAFAAEQNIREFKKMLLKV